MNRYLKFFIFKLLLVAVSLPVIADKPAIKVYDKGMDGGMRYYSVDCGNGNIFAFSQKVLDTDDVMMVTNKGRIIRSPVNDIRIASRNTQGVTLFSIDEGEKVVSVTTISLDDEEDNDEVITDNDNIEDINNLNEDVNKND